MRGDHPPFNFDAFSTHQPRLSYYLCQPQNKRKRKKDVMRNKVKTIQTISFQKSSYKNRPIIIIIIIIIT
jgi:hypothetical protein